MRKVARFYKCGRCFDTYEYEDGAIECCAPEVTEVYQCPDCENLHDKRDLAEACCGAGTLSKCPRCSRDYIPATMAHHAIQIAGHCQTCNPFFTHDQQFQIEAAMDDHKTDEYGWPTGDRPSLLRGEAQVRPAS